MTLFLMKKRITFIATDFKQSAGAEKVWKKMLSKSSAVYEIVDDETGEVLDMSLDDVWGNDPDIHVNVIIILRKL